MFQPTQDSCQLLRNSEISYGGASCALQMNENIFKTGIVILGVSHSQSRNTCDGNFSATACAIIMVIVCSGAIFFQDTVRGIGGRHSLRSRFARDEAYQ
jgi:hypothetical protein